MNTTQRLTVDSPAGPLTLAAENDCLTGISFGTVGPDASCTHTPLLDEAARQLEEYFNGLRRDFDLPLAPSGTLFQRKVWDALRQIPYGQTRSYKQIACAAGHPLAYRAVGMANNRNPLPIVIPCHRVVGSSGALVGYAGGLDIKRLLLDLEGAGGFGETPGCDFPGALISY